MSKVNDTKLGQLPRDGQYVLGLTIDRPWLDSGDEEGFRFFRVVKFVIIDEKKSTSGRRKKKSNKSEIRDVKWKWVEFGPGQYQAQEIELWWDLGELSGI